MRPPEPIIAIRYTAALSLLLLAATCCRAQGIVFGPAFGLEAGTMAGSVPVFAGLPDCGMFNDGTLRGERVGGRALLPGMFLDDIGLSLGVGWSRRRAEFSTLPVDPFWVSNSLTEGSVRGEREFRLSTTIDRIELEMMGALRLGRFGLGIGPAVAYTVGSDIVQTDTILGPGTVAFADGASSRRMTQGTVMSARPLGLGGVAAAWYAAKFGTRFDLQVELAGTMDLISPVAGTGFRSFGLRGTVALLFDPARTQDNVRMPPPAVAAVENAIRTEDTPLPIAELIPPRRTTLSASIALYGVNTRGEPSDAATVHVRETTIRRHIMLDPALRFDAGSASIPEHYVRYSREGADRFAIDSLRGLDDPSLQDEILNVIGTRMRANPAATIVLGTTPGTRPRAQATAVRSYLADAWGVDTARIALGADHRSSNDVRDEALVVITTRDTAILAPLAFEQVGREFNIPIVKLDPTFQSAAGIKGWTISLSHQGAVIARYASRGETEREDSLYEWQPMFDRLAGDTSHLEAIFTIEDSTGATETAHARIPLRVQLDRRTILEQQDLRSGRTLYLYHIPVEVEDTATGNPLIWKIAAGLRERDEVSVLPPPVPESGNGPSPSHMRERTTAVATAIRNAARERGIRSLKLSQRSEGADTLARFLSPASARDIRVLIYRSSAER